MGVGSAEFRHDLFVVCATGGAVRAACLLLGRDLVKPFERSILLLETDRKYWDSQSKWCVCSVCVHVGARVGM